MKKLICITAGLLCAMSLNARGKKTARIQGQPKFYVAASGGYYFPVFEQQSFESRYVSGAYSATKPGNNTYETVTFGDGPIAALAVGFKAGKIAGIEAGVMGNLREASYTFQNLDGGDRWVTSARPLYATLSATAHTRLSSKVNFYGRFGVAIALKNGVRQEYYRQIITGGNAAPVAGYSERAYRFRFSPGIIAAAGFEYLISRQWSVQAELSGIARNATTKSSSLKAYSENGTDRMSTLALYERETVYNDDMQLGGGPARPNMPREATPSAVSFSGAGFAVGLRYNFR